ncbi:pyridoxal-phosphate dependent enzyme [Streptomyces sedi]|uniref:Pyridoxal-phosphate dependent enzyme n=1 Tax=Streptomyces sedi TaxID=555059 RepID=A0A5C4VBG8_9ACTN|nr:pyridoxal-phosphate dependent enzyme [Streptomyces sedi]TNM32875.1 pyridoxal-phosphate dependent enzyme [Streptomyces sedi]
MPAQPPTLIDRAGRRYPVDRPRWRGDDGSPLMPEPLPGITRREIDTAVNSQWRYRAALPLPEAEPVTLGEGRTPLLEREWAGLRVAVKPESTNPTGSFKDRGVSVMVSALRHQGVTRLLEDSSGNGGSSVAAYSAAAGIGATIIAPVTTSASKIVQSRLHGAEVELVPGTRQEVADEAVRRAEGLFYASHNWHPQFLQGTKLLAYEIWEDLGFTAPSVVLVPAGAGSLVLGCALGFAELRNAGEIDRVPRVLISQPERCAPLARALAAGAEAVEAADWRRTLAEGTAIAQPVRDREVLRAIRDTGGAATSVPEDELLPAVRELAAGGLFVEPTSAQVLPALRRFREAGVVGPEDTVVTVLTGSGLKAASVLSGLLDGRAG